METNYKDMAIRGFDCTDTKEFISCFFRDAVFVPKTPKFQAGFIILGFRVVKENKFERE